MGRKSTMGKHSNGPIIAISNRNMPVALHNRMRAFAFRFGMSISRVMVEAIELGLRSMEEAQGLSVAEAKAAANAAAASTKPLRGAAIRRDAAGANANGKAAAKRAGKKPTLDLVEDGSDEGDEEEEPWDAVDVRDVHEAAPRSVRKPRSAEHRK